MRYKRWRIRDVGKLVEEVKLGRLEIQYWQIAGMQKWQQHPVFPQALCSFENLCFQHGMAVAGGRRDIGHRHAICAKLQIAGIQKVCCSPRVSKSMSRQDDCKAAARHAPGHAPSNDPKGKWYTRGRDGRTEESHYGKRSISHPYLSLFSWWWSFLPSFLLRCLMLIIWYALAPARLLMLHGTWRLPRFRPPFGLRLCCGHHKWCYYPSPADESHVIRSRGFQNARLDRSLYLKRSCGSCRFSSIGKKYGIKCFSSRGGRCAWSVSFIGDKCRLVPSFLRSTRGLPQVAALFLLPLFSSIQDPDDL